MSIDVQLMLGIGRIAALFGAVLVLIWAFRAWRGSTERDAQRMFEQLDLIRGELLLLAEQVEQRPAQQQQPAVRVEASEPRVAPVMQNSAPRGYEVAARLARGGATCEELISSCGLSRHEAQLLLRLHDAEAKRNTTSNKAIATEKPSDKVNEARRPRLSAVG